MFALIPLFLTLFLTVMAKPQPIVQVGTIYLTPGTDVKAGNAKAIWDAAINTVSKQPGAEGLWWGYQHENSNNLQIVLQYRDKKTHDAFTTSSTFRTFSDNIKKLSREQFQFHKYTFPQSILSTVEAPVTDFTYQYVTDEKARGFRKIRDQFEAVANDAAGLSGVTSAQAAEDIQGGYFGGGKGKLWMTLVGWESIEIHYKWAETEDFTKAFPLLLDNTVGIEVVHAPLTEAFKKF